MALEKISGASFFYNRKGLTFVSPFSEATTRFELVIRVLQTHALPLGYVALQLSQYIKKPLICQEKTFRNDSYGNRTRVTAVKGRCLNRLTKEPELSSRNDRVP